MWMVLSIYQNENKYLHALILQILMSNFIFNKVNKIFLAINPNL